MIHRNVEDSGRKDILTLGEARDATPFLEIEIYRAGREGAGFNRPQDELGVRAAAVGPTANLHIASTAAEQIRRAVDGRVRHNR